LSYEEERAPFLPVPLGGAERRYSEETARDIDRAVHAIAQAAFDRAVAILTKHRATLEDGARRLLRQETLSEEDIAGLAATLRE
jgi:cell division protease FtsH